jgi:hypothetical protein
MPRRAQAVTEEFRLTGRCLRVRAGVRRQEQQTPENGGGTPCWFPGCCGRGAA